MMIEPCDGGVRLQLWIQPRASKDEIVGVQGDALKVRITAPPVEGKANAALVRFLAKQLGVARSQVSIAGGESGRKKIIEVLGLNPAQAQRQLGLGERNSE